MISLETDYIILIIKFRTDTQTLKNVSNDIRRAFLGLDRGSPKIPKKIQEIVNSNHELIKPIHFALMKDPIKTEVAKGKYKIQNPAVGAIIIYEYIGLSQEFDTSINQFRKYLLSLLEEKKYKYLEYCSDVKLIIGKELD